jgi:hypothetical protein
MSIRKTRLVPAEPKVGRYRLFDADSIRAIWRCRVCDETVRADHKWIHWNTEMDKRPPEVLAAIIAVNLRARTSRRNRAHAQYQYATKGEPWRR